MTDTRTLTVDKGCSLTQHVKSFVPDARGEELELRVAILRRRDWAAAFRTQAVSPLALDLASCSHEFAGLMVFRAPESLARLQHAATLCQSLIQAAMAADALESMEAPL